MTVVSADYRVLQTKLRNAVGSFNEERIQRAWEVAERAYANERHWTGVSTMDHVLAVLDVLLPFQPDEDSIIACLLHHVLQSQYWKVSDLEQQFGPKIRELVSGVHLLSRVTLHERRASIDDLKLMLVTVSDDIRTVVIVLCDRLVLLHHAARVEKFMARRVAQDALQLFAPVAARLGIYTLKHQIEAEAFPISYPRDAERITEQMQQAESRHPEFLQRTKDTVEEYLHKRGIEAVIECRQKQPYSIFRKMREKSLTHILDLYDYYALRVIVSDEATCYQALGLLHQLGRPVGNRFKDYIAFPKPNGYRSLHTTLAHIPTTGDDAALVEVQVRTPGMHREADYGVAAHWMYKEKGSAVQTATHIQLHDVLSAQDTMADANTLADHIFVLTPRGDVVELPEGATPLDFAFQVHTEVGIAYRGARVNGSMVSMDYELENGDIVEILRHKNPKPSAQWLQLLKMASSRSKLKRFLYAQERPDLIIRGRELLNRELRRHHLPLLDTSLSALRSYNGRPLNTQEREDILVKLGQGSEKPGALLSKLDALQQHRPDADNAVGTVDETFVGSQQTIVVEGGVPLPYRFAKCCKPQEQPAVAVQGVVNRRGKVMVHRSDCGMLRHANPERQVRVWWNDDATE